MEELPEQFKCPICFDILLNKIYQCNQGHIICEKCCENITQCPQCRVSFDFPRIRNRALEALLDSDSLKLFCPHKPEGCKETLKIKDIHRHSIACSFNPDCINMCALLGYDTCNYMFNASRAATAIKHFKSKHDFIVHSSSEVAFHVENFRHVASNASQNSKNYLWTPIVLKCPSETPGAASTCFLVLTKLNTDDHTISFLCVLIRQNGHVDKEASKDFLAHLFIVNSNNNPDLENLEWIIPSVGILKSKTTLQNMPIRIPLSLLLQHYTDDNTGSLLVNISIEQRSPRQLEFRQKVQTKHTDLEVVHVTATAWMCDSDIDHQSSADPKSNDKNQHQQQKPSASTSKELTTPESHKSVDAVQNIQPQPSSFINPPPPQNPVEISPKHCDECKVVYLGAVYFKCLECPYFILCPNCCWDRKCHDEHALAQLNSAMGHDEIFAKAVQWPECRQPLLSSRGKMVLSDSVLNNARNNFTCDGIKTNLLNSKNELTKCGNALVTFVCLQCKNYQLCMTCIREGHFGLHDIRHIMAIVHNKEQLHRVKIHLINRFPIFMT